MNGVREANQQHSSQYAPRGDGSSGPAGKAVPGSSNLTVTHLTSNGDFAALRDEWNALLSTSRSDTICLTWEWLWNWWLVFGRDRQLTLLTIRDSSGGLAAIAPFAIRRVAHAGALPVRRVELLGTGEPAKDAIWSEYLDVIAKRGLEAPAAAAIAGYLTDQLCSDWDEIHLTNTRDRSLAGAVGEALNARGFKIARIERAPSLFLPLPTDPDAVAELLSPRTRRKLRCYLRKLDAAGGIELELCASKTDLASWMEQLVDLHQRRWSVRGQCGVFASADFSSFHQRLAPVLLEQNRLAFYMLNLRGRKVAAVYGFRHGKTVAAYQSGFDLDFDRTISLGLVTYSLCLREAVRTGMTEWDFLRGDEPYKKLWPTVSRRYIDMRIWNTGMRAEIARYAFWTLRGAKAAVRPALVRLGLRRKELSA
jgi:CelD/BcsL family acetyltransferase involved in cellulose biosynthesis